MPPKCLWVSAKCEAHTSAVIAVKSGSGEVPMECASWSSWSSWSLDEQPLYPVSAFPCEQTLQKVTLLQTWVRRAKQRKRSARTVEFVTWCETKSVVGARVAVG